MQASLMTQHRSIGDYARTNSLCRDSVRQDFLRWDSTAEMLIGDLMHGSLAVSRAMESAENRWV